MVMLTFFALTGLVALVDWVAVARVAHRVELAAKPLTLALLLVAACFADLGSAKGWVLAALVLGLIGDIALMFAQQGATDLAFLGGLACFGLGHLAYVVAFVRHGLHGWQVLAGVLVVGGATSLVMPRVLRAVQAAGGGVLAGAVALYAVALGAMAILGLGTGAVATAIGALLFLASDTTLSWDRFVQPLLRGPTIVIVTYHVAQVLIVIGLIR
ncbi:MAG: lysoplasmalogenase [Actinomycetota bacterium]|nr:lysoplasmalogenase [Actinomycetota bacterium]